MPRIRTVKPEFFSHYELFIAEKESKLPIRLAYVGLWTCADQEGRFKWQPEQLKLFVLPHDKVNFSKILEVLLKNNFILKYSFDGKEYGCIPTLVDHQRFSGREALEISKLPPPPITLGSNAEEIGKQSGSNTEEIGKQRGMQEGKGREGKGKEESSSPENNLTCYDAEKEILSNKIWIEQLCMNLRKEKSAAELALRKYHLHLTEEEKYPKTRKAVYAGFEKWLLNEQNYKNGKSVTLAVSPSPNKFNDHKK